MKYFLICFLFLISLKSYSYTIENEAGNYAAPILAGQNILAGNIVVSNSNDNLIINASSDSLNNWFIQKVHIYASSSNGIAGTPIPGQFPYHSIHYSPAVSQYNLQVPLISLNIDCNSRVYMAIHLEMVRVVNGVIVQSETGWAYGLDPFNSNRWGWQFVYQAECEQNVVAGCTLTQGYWKNHSKYSKPKKVFWPKEVGIAGDSEDRKVCGMTWYKILTTTPKIGNAWMILAHQWIAAKLNKFNGASVLEQLSLNQAQSLLEANCSSIKSSSTLGQQAVVFAGILAAYNEGRLEVPHCSK